MSDDSTQPMFCYAHPQRETLLRCNRCDRPMCTSCAVKTPTGYRCKECVRGQQKTFETTQWWDYPVTILVAGVLAYFASLLTNIIGFYSIFLAPVAGFIITEAVRFTIRKRRSRLIPPLAAGSTLCGGLLLKLLLVVVVLFFNPSAGITGIFGLLWPAIFSIVAASTVYYRLKGIRL